ncbi:hypothetical protein jhhlp_003394 [Lomentospora prolificans]|uniref:TOG domain-containing protein n=1 Tax=Lomentospora prolificans TaxID=41688 RepID=A0A2N3N8M8_9PEZI|nr:hypothetical protein jhhlp_003394 [Lomentospora prolificans]
MIDREPRQPEKNYFSYRFLPSPSPQEMTERITDKQVADLQALLLKSDVITDNKVNAVNAVKSGIKQHNVPETCVPQLFDALRSASVSQHAALANAGFSSLNHLLTRLSRQEPKFVSKEAMRTMPVVIEKLGDQKDKLRAIATQAMTTVYGIAPAEVERSVRNTAMSGKNPRAKEASMHWLVTMHKEQGMQFRTYVPLLMDLLEDTDGMVRDVAKSTVIELFKTAPAAAKSDLKRQLKNFKVRTAIEQAIVKALAPTGGERSEVVTPSLTTSVSSLAGADRPVTPMFEGKADSVEPTYVNTQRELDEIFREMGYHFEGRETEQNWMKREEGVTILRRLIVGNAPSDFPDAYIAGVRALLDGIIKAINSLRTSLSKEGCALVQDLANCFGPRIDPMVELLMQTLLKLSASTKKIASQLANTTIDIILSKVSFSNRLLQHISSASQDKNVQPRLYATGWMKTILLKEEQHKAHIEHGGGLDLVEKSIKKGLADANPGVREKSRATYWTYAKIWPGRAEIIMENLDSTAQKLLQKDPNNPNSPKKATTTTTTARPGLGLSKSTMGGAKPSLRETVMAGRKALGGGVKNVPARPGSAMAGFSPVRNGANSAAPAPVSSGPVQPRQRPESTLAVNSGGMSAAPTRPTRRRPELAARPATAGPYSVRSHGGPSAEASSPADTVKSTKSTVSKPSTTSSPRRTGQRPRPGHASHASESSIPSPTKAAFSKPSSPAKTGSVRTTPVKLKKTQSSPGSAGSASRAEELTLVVPTIGTLQSTPPRVAPPMPSPIPETPIMAASESTPTTTPKDLSPSKALQVYEDPFVDDQSTPKLAAFTGPVLEDRPINENTVPAPLVSADAQAPDEPPSSPEKSRQNSRLLESGITRVKAKSLDVHGFRKFQSLIRDNKAVFSGDKFETLLLGLFDFLQDPLENTPPEKVPDIKAQVLATIKLLLKKDRFNFQPHVSTGLESLLRARSAYEARTYIVSGLELLADELVTLGDASELVMTLTAQLDKSNDTTPEGCRCLGMGMHALRQLLEKRTSYVPSQTELQRLAGLESRCLDSADSGVRMDAVQLCVAMHTRIGEAAFWEALKDIKDDPKNLITYYIVKKQREQEGEAA